MITNTQSEKDKATRLTGAQKAAVLMVSLGEHTGAEILKHLDEDEVASIGKEVARLSSLSSEDAETTLEEFYTMSMAQ
ncbi:MAG TPA: flagellar motor switch protein FliG, partial [Solibacterales bacterium]|nr:flagellar motor switch protein FliG [Bryobacterales bacterium]